LTPLLGRVPPHVSTIAADFEHEDLHTALARTDFHRRAPTLFIWEGVTSYLSAAAVDATLRRLAMLAAPGSQLVFTYLDHATPEGRSELVTAAHSADAEQPG
jgi:methyltransferase (TIGR00027 family)